MPARAPGRAPATPVSGLAEITAQVIYPALPVPLLAAEDFLDAADVRANDNPVAGVAQDKGVADVGNTPVHRDSGSLGASFLLLDDESSVAAVAESAADPEDEISGTASRCFSGSPADDTSGAPEGATVTGSGREDAAQEAVQEPAVASTAAAGTDAVQMRRHPASPVTALECISFLLRATFRVRDKRDESIFPFIGIAFIVAKLGFLARTLDEVTTRVLHATIVELFNTPINALKFMEQTFEVAANGLHLGGRLMKSRHVSGQPASFCSADFNRYLNPEGRLTQWLSRALCLREGLTFRPGISYGPGGLTKPELDALAIRLLSQAAVNAATGAGCRVHYCRTADNSLAVSEVVFAWDIQLGMDNRINNMLRSLRHELLKSPPQRLTQSSHPAGAVLPRSIPVEALPVTPAADTPLVVDTPSSSPGAGNLSSRHSLAPVTHSAPPALAAVLAAASERATTPAAASPAGGLCETGAAAAGIVKPPSVGNGRASTKGKGSASRFPGGKGRKAPSSSGSGRTRKQRPKRVEVEPCLCGSAGAASGGATWIIAEVRRLGGDALLGMAIGVQLSWATDMVVGGRLDLSYCLRRVALLSDGSVHQYVLNVDETHERTSNLATDARSVVSQLPTVQANYMSLDFASVVERQCDVSLAASTQPAVISGANDAGRTGSVSDGALPVPGDSVEGGPATSPDTAQAAPTERGIGSPVSRNAASDTNRAADGGQRRLRMVVIDGPVDVSPLALTISFRSPSELSPELGKATRFPGRLILFFPANTTATTVVNRC